MIEEFIAVSATNGQGLQALTKRMTVALQVRSNLMFLHFSVSIFVNNFIQNKGIVGKKVNSSYLVLARYLASKIDNLPINTPPLCAFSKFEEICKELEIDSAEEGFVTRKIMNVFLIRHSLAANFLHKMGTIVYFSNDKSLKDIIFFDPLWLVEIFSSVLTAKLLIKVKSLIYNT